MKNTILNFDKRNLTEFIVSDYTSRNFRPILDLPELQDKTWIDYIVLDDDQKIEQISQTLYGSPDYWDVLMLINGRDPLFDMVYNSDVLSDIAKEIINKFASEYSGRYKQETFDDLIKAKTKQIEARNEELRTMKIIRPEKIHDFIKILRAMDMNQ